MFDLWKDELTEEETSQLIDKIVEEITKRKLNVPAILLFESHKPLAFMGSQAALVCSPLLVPIIGFDNVNNYSRLLAERKNIDTIVDRLVLAAEDGEKPTKKKPFWHRWRKDLNPTKEISCNT